MVPATREAEVGGSPEPGEVKAAVNRDCTPCSIRPGQRNETLSKKKEREERKKKKKQLEFFFNITF